MAGHLARRRVATVAEPGEWNQERGIISRGKWEGLLVGTQTVEAALFAWWLGEAMIQCPTRPRGPTLRDSHGYVLGQSADAARRLAIQDATFAEASGLPLVTRGHDVSAESGVMGGDRNTIHLVTADGVESWDNLPKAQVATRLAARIADAFS